MAKSHEHGWMPSDDDWTGLLDEEGLSHARAKAENKYKNFSQDQIKHVRRLAKTDLFFLASGLLEYELITEGFHGHYCNWLQSQWGRQFRLTLQARGHYKSTVNTISDSIQMALPNDAGVQFLPYSLGPDVKLLLGHENRESASRFLFEIIEAFTRKEAMLAFFPECIPSRRVQRVNKWELELPRKSHSKEPTFDTIGAGGASQGRHYNWLKLDDLVGEDARDSETVMKRILNWFDNVNSLMTRPRYDGWDLIGTHWANNDVYAHAIRMYGVDKKASYIRNYFKKDIANFEDGDLAVYGRAIEEDGVIAFPEEFPATYIARLKKNPMVFAAQYANNPKDSSLTMFQEPWQKFYNIGRGGRLTVFAGESSWSVDQRDLDICILVDPSLGETEHADPTGIVVTGTDKFMNIYILEAYKKRLLAHELNDELFMLYTRWWPRVISVESVAFSSYVGKWFEQKCNELRLYPNIHYYKVAGKGAKRSRKRIGGLTSYFAGGQVYMLEGMTQLRDELDWFPLGDSEHILDALAQGPEVWVPGLDTQARDDMQEAEEDILEHRSQLTGY